MKNYKLLITTLLALFLFSSCIKTKDDTYTISGHVYESCGVPAANQSLLFYQSGGGSKEAGTATTDASGAFTLTYQRNNGSDLRVGQPAGFGYSDVMHIKSNTNYSNIKIYKQLSCILKVSINVLNNSYTNQDTLYIPDFRPSAASPYQYKVPGPFTSKTLYIVPYFKFFEYTHGGMRNNLSKNFRLNNTNISQDGVELKLCDTVNYMLEIK